MFVAFLKRRNNERDWKASGYCRRADDACRGCAVVRFWAGMAGPLARRYSLFQGKFSFLFSDSDLPHSERAIDAHHVADEEMNEKGHKKKYNEESIAFFPH